jgi:hypothetical protein
MGTPADCTMLAALARLRENLDWELDHGTAEDAPALEARINEVAVLFPLELEACRELHAMGILPEAQTNPQLIYIEILACQIAGNEWVGAMRGLTWSDDRGWE